MTARSTIPACFADVSRITTRSAYCSDEPNPVKTESRALDGGLAQPDADGRGCRPRGHARAQRVPAHGNPLHAGSSDVVSPGPSCRRLCSAAHLAVADACQPRPAALLRAARLVLRVDADSARTGRIARIHHADLDGHPGGELSRRTHHDLEDPGDRAWSDRRFRDR